jgi:hypothetical protein
MFAAPFLSVKHSLTAASRVARLQTAIFMQSMEWKGAYDLDARVFVGFLPVAISLLPDALMDMLT